MEQTIEQGTVVTDPVDAGQAVETNSTSSSETVENKAVDAPVGEAIKKEVERRIAKEQAKIAQEARDAYIREQGFSWNGKAINTEKEYRDALKEQELYESFREQAIPDEVIPELVEARKVKEATNAQKQLEQVYQEFLSAYPDVEGKDIPDEVWKQVDLGKSLVDAYMAYENKLLKQQLSEISGKQQKADKLAENRALSTGSVTGMADGAGSTYFTPEQVETMSRDEINRNWNIIMDSQKRWYKK